MGSTASLEAVLGSTSSTTGAATETKTEVAAAPAAEATLAEGASATTAAAEAKVDPEKKAEPAAPAAETKKVEDKAAPAPAKTEPAKEEKKVDAPKDPNAPPEKYELKAPEGSLVQAENLAALEAFAKEKGYSQAQAQALVDREHFERASLQQRRDGWLKEVTEDKEIGGADLPKNLELSKRVIERFGSEKFKQILNDTGLGNHPELFRFAVRMGKAAGEDVFVSPGGPNGSDAIEHKQVFFPSMTAKK